jgi:hypothetical protein
MQPWQLRLDAKKEGKNPENPAKFYNKTFVYLYLLNIPRHRYNGVLLHELLPR